LAINVQREGEAMKAAALNVATLLPVIVKEVTFDFPWSAWSLSKWSPAFG
jgi:hypothetical protein